MQLHLGEENPENGKFAWDDLSPQSVRVDQLVVEITASETIKGRVINIYPLLWKFT
jgi:hypothetical protein